MTTESRSDAQPRGTINRILSGWQSARALMAANHLGFFSTLGKEPLSAEEMASRCGTHPRSTRMLLNACVALGVLEKEGPLYRNSAEARELLVPGKPTYIGDGIAHQEDLWLPWGGLHEAVRTNRRVSEEYRLVREPTVHRNFILAMHDGAMRVAPLVAEALDLSGRRSSSMPGAGPARFPSSWSGGTLG